MVARPYLRTPRTKIVQTAHLVQRKRHELVAAIAKGLVPPDTSPATKKKKNFRIDVRTACDVMLMPLIKNCIFVSDVLYRNSFESLELILWRERN